jgi:hypothetical protein
VEQSDGVKKAEHNAWFQRTKKEFNYAHTGS